jgi:hypothetical protein
MAEEKQEKSSLGERMSDVAGMRVLRDGKWVLLSEISKPIPKKEPVTASSYFNSVVKPREPLPVVIADADYGDKCPPATQDIVLNINNRQNAIDKVGYGPLNPNEPNEDFWEDKADRWDIVNTEDAKKSICGNCVFFDRRPKTLDCIEAGLAEGGSGEESAWDAIDQAELGYCTALDFKCAASRTCNAWAAGGPITEDVKKEEQPVVASGVLVPEEQDLADALRVIVEKHGKFNEDNTGVWAGYDSAEKNAENAAIGVKCGNCVFWNAPNGCDIISHETEEGGLCRFAVLPDGTVTPEKVFSKAPNLIQEELKEKIYDMGDNYTEESVNISDLIPTQDYLDPIKMKGAGDNTKLITVYLDDEGYKLVDGHHRCAHKVGGGQNRIMAKVYRGPLVSASLFTSIPISPEDMEFSADGPCWDGYKQVGMKNKNGKMVPNCVPDDEASMTATAGSKPAPKKDQIKGSSKNPKGSASGSKTVNFSKKVEESLSNKVKEHNEKSDRKASLRMLKAVYRRGAGAFSSSHRPDQNRNSWAMARVNAFLHLLKSGSPKNSKYTTDNDLLPASHPKSSKKSVRASGESFPYDETGTEVYEYDYSGELTIVLLPETEYTSREQAIFALAEYSGVGYEIIPALDATWSRAINSKENGFDRAKELATSLQNSRDADLLPKEF